MPKKPRSTPPARPSTPAWLPPLLIAAAFAHNLSLSWLKWGNILVDGGRELELPRRMLAGERLYADLRFYYGPFAPYLNTALYGLFGVHVNVVLAAGLTSVVLAAIAIDRLLRRFVSPLDSAIVVVAFLYLCAFGHVTANGSFNFVLPYSYSATYGMVAALWSLWFLVRYEGDGRAAALVASVLCLVIAALSKIEALVPAVAVHVASVVLAVLWRRPGVRTQIAALALGALSFATILGALAWRCGDTLWNDNLASLLNQGSKTYIYSIMGLDDVAGALHDGWRSSIYFALSLAVGWGVARVVGRDRRLGVRGVATIYAAGVAVLLLWSSAPVTQTFRAAPLVAVLALGGLLARAAQHPDERRGWVPHLLIWIFALGAMSRIPLRVTAHHYGFYLLPGALIALGLLFFDYLPRFAAAGEWARIATSVVGGAYFLGAVVPHAAYSSQQYGRHTVELSSPRGRLWLADPFAAKAVRFLSRFPAGTRVLVIPQGAGLVFFSGTTGADGMFSHLPMEFFGRYDDAGVLARWKARPPDVVVWYRQEMSEFGYLGFGDDYAEACGKWLRENYVPFGTSRTFLRRKAGVDPVS